jgi:hypothetical protein
MTLTEYELRMAAIAYLKASIDKIPPETLPAAQRLLAAVKASQRKEEECQRKQEPQSNP